MSDRVALVTGGSRGIGRAVCIALASKGLSVAVNYRAGTEDAKETLALIEATSGEGIVVQGDVSDPLQIETMFKEVEDALGPVSILINNAGIRRDGLTARMSDEDWNDVVSVNLFGPFACARRALRSMIRERYGRIVNITSVGGIRGNPGQANYCAAKAGLIGFTRSLAREVGKKNITVNAVAPGLIETELTTSLGEDRYGQLLSEIPAGRAGTPEDVAGLVAFLCSEDSSYVNGSVFVTDGGLTA